jgi:hypothetical protein
MGAVAHLEIRSLSVTPGAEAVAVIRVRNTGTVVDQFTVDVLGDAATWATSEPPTLSLFPGAEETARVTFRPPRNSTVPAGTMPFALRVRSHEDPAGSTVEEGVLEIEPFSDTFAELAPRTSRGSRGASHDIAIDNRGNARLNATLSAADPDKLLEFDIRPPAIVADPGVAAFAKVQVKARERFWRGTPKTRPFRLQLESPGGPPIGVDGTMLQEAILPSWLLKAVIAAVTVLVALVLLWLFFLQPAIQSTARQRADEALVARLGPSPVGQTPFPTGGGGVTPPLVPTPPVATPGGGGGSPSPSAGGGSPSPSPSSGASPSTGTESPSPSPSGPVLGDATPIDGRLLPGAPLPPVEAGKTLFITDLVFSNSSDTAVGDLRLERAGQPLLILRLENFRDLDYHFVTPIVIQAGQQLALTCDGCTSAAVYYSGYTR